MQRMEQNQMLLLGASQQQLIQNSLPQIALQDLLNSLNADPSVSASDENLARMSGASLDMRSQDRIALVFQDPGFQAWFRSQNSAILAIDISAADQDATPALSYFVATLAQVLREMMVTMPMLFFCREHTSPQDPLQGAVGILRTLNSKLIPQLENFNLAFVDQNFLEKIQNADIYALSSLFQGLISQDKGSVFFIILDELSIYDTRARCDDIRDVIQFLRQIVQMLNAESAQNRRQTVLKILVTCSSMSYYSRSWFQDDEILTVPLDAHGQSQGFNELQMSWHAQQLMDSANGPPDAAS